MTKFHYAGKYNGDPSSIASHEHEPGHVPFKEIKDMNKLGIFINLIALLIGFVLIGIYFYLCRKNLDFVGIILAIIAAIPHEFLHALCFKGDVYMYEALSRGMLFVSGPGTFSKAEFVFMCLLPNIVFGFIPFIIFLFNPSNTLLGTFGLVSIASGAGDYYNVFNALTQVPNGARIYNNGMSTYWYMPKENA